MAGKKRSGGRRMVKIVKVLDSISLLLAYIAIFFIGIFIIFNFALFLPCGLGGGIIAGFSCCYEFLTDTWTFWAGTILAPISIAFLLILISSLLSQES